jgi:hypothetical protein
MKIKLKRTFQSLLLPIRSSSHLSTNTSLTSPIFFVLAIILGLGCAVIKPQVENTENVPSNQIIDSSIKKIHVAFAGGGWRAHTGHSAWIISLLNGNRNLNEAFGNVGTVGSNSGGSWFSTMLMFSKKFVNDIEAKNAARTWGITGWLGKQKINFNKTPCPSGKLYLPCIFDSYTLHYKGWAYWNLVVEKLVFNNYSLGNTTLSGVRQPWAANKSLLLASTMLNNSVVLNGYKEDLGHIHRYYQACLSPSNPVLNGDEGSSCSNGTTKDVTPVVFSSIPNGLNLKSPPFFSELGGNTFNLGYTEDYAETNKAPKKTATIQGRLNDDNVKAMVAAGASSAAVGFGASENIAQLFDLAYNLEDEALSFQLTNGIVQYVDAEKVSEMSLEELAENKVVRLADGGTVDNSGVAQVVSFLQLNKQADDFNIVAFDNVQIPRKLGNGAIAGGNIASLFGYPIKFCAEAPYIDEKLCVDIPDLQIFDGSAFKTTSETWTTTDGNQQLIYTKYTVQTTDNSILGVSEGSKGTLHAFTCISPEASTVPAKGNTDFNNYDSMFKFINLGLKQNNGEGLKHLEAAFGIN